MKIQIIRGPPIRATVLVAVALFLVMLFCANAAAQDLDSTLQFMSPLLGPTWSGHYVDSPDDDHLQHVVRWTAVLDGKVVKKVKAVAAADFCEVSLYYWDARVEQVSFLSVTNRGQQSYGSVRFEDGRVVMSGERPEGRSFVLSFEMSADGKLWDTFLNVVDGELKQGHLIEYTATSGAELDEVVRCDEER